ncbi:MAG: hypothetical protein H0V09_09065, partial [Gemmatimonadetes bacterium]|nr:hypothetical protein [Gemmatimonadota bacterium]
MQSSDPDAATVKLGGSALGWMAVMLLPLLQASAGAQVLDFELFRTSRVMSVFDNRGIFLQDPRTGAGFAFFPADSPNSYGFGSGLWVGGLVNGVRVVSTTYDAAGGFSEFVPGRVAERGGGADDILCSDVPADLARWYPEFSDPVTGEPIVRSERDCVVIYNDANQSRDVTTPIGLEVRQRTMTFDRGYLSQALFVQWDVVNAGSDAVDDAFLAVNADMDIGDPRDDRCSAVRSVPPGNNNPTQSRIRTDLGFCWDDDFFELEFDPNPPGFIGLTLLDSGRDAPGRDPGLTRFTLTTNPSEQRPQPDPQTDADQYDLLQGFGARSPFIDAVPTDVRFVAISGPFTLPPRASRRITAAYLWADVSHGRRVLAVSP